jgi:transposase InsO family protein
VQATTASSSINLSEMMATYSAGTPCEGLHSVQFYTRWSARNQADLNYQEAKGDMVQPKFYAGVEYRHIRQADCIWFADITYIETDQGWLYLVTVMDLCSRRIVGWAMAHHLRAELPLAALRMAISVQRPGSGLIHHSDRGVHGLPVSL